MTKRPISWMYGVTTVPSRMSALLPRTLNSLAAAGFPEPRLFIDAGVPNRDYAKFDLEITERFPPVKTAGNWILAMWELYLREPNAHRYTIFQDDVVFCKNLRAYLDKCEYPTMGYWNLNTYPQNEELAGGHKGWYFSNQMGRGAQALVFNNEAVMTLLSQPKLLELAKDGKRGTQSVDGQISISMRKSGWKEYVHAPSLACHTGVESTIIGHVPHPFSETFPGEEKDAMSFLQNGPTYLQKEVTKKVRHTLSAYEIKALVTPEKSPLVLEIGCHDGSDTVKFLDAMPAIDLHCFEPDERANKRFKERTGEDDRITFFPLAVADVDGPRDFFASTGRAGGRDDWDLSGSLCKPTGHLTRSPEISFKSPVPIDCLRLDTWMAENRQGRCIDFIWADLQGSQQLLIDGGRKALAKTRYLYIESHDPVAYAGEPTQSELVLLLAEWFEPVAIYAEENILFKNKEQL